MGIPSPGNHHLETSYSDHEFVAELYDHVVPYRDRADIDFYREQAERLGGSVLELGCGTGRVLLPIARSGIPIVGVDLSEHMLSVLRRRLEEETDGVRSRVELVQGDMTRINLDRRFGLVTSPFRAFQHLLTVEAQVSTIKNAYKMLNPGGYLVMDVFNPSLLALTAENIGEEFGDEPEFELPDGRRVVRSHRVIERDHINQISSVELIYRVVHPDGRRERLVHSFKMRHLFRFEMEHLLVRCGFDVQSVYSDFNRKPYGEIYPGELIFVARKPER